MTVNTKDPQLYRTAIDMHKTYLTTIDNVDVLLDWTYLPKYLAPNHEAQYPHSRYASCSFCGVGDSGFLNQDSKSCSTKVNPSTGCVKLKYSRMKSGSAYPIQTAPSIMSEYGNRSNIPYREAINYFADLLLDYMQDDAQILIYACGQVDYFAIFAMQEVFRILGIRNLTGNAEHCLNAGAMHNEILTGQEGPFVTIEQALAGDDKFYILNGWNGLVTHPPIFNQLIAKPNLNAVLFDVMLTETGQSLQNKLSESHVGLIKPSSDPQLALAVAHCIFTHYPEAIEMRFIDNWSDEKSFNDFKTIAMRDTYHPQKVANKIAAEARFEKRIYDIIQKISVTLISENIVPIIIPSVGLSQSSGVVAHCLWAGVIAMLGKFGLANNSDLMGGVLRLPGQINAESEVQGLSRKFFMGRIPMSDAAEAARRMELPEHAYDRVLQDKPIAALDYSEPSSKRQLFLFFGTQFEANMPNRKQWLNKLIASENKIVVIDPIVDTWSLINSELIIPSPPHPATPKLYQNGEWRLSLSVPQKKAPSETRSDATIIYDVMAEIVMRFSNDKYLLAQYPHLIEHYHSGYLQRRFCPPDINYAENETCSQVMTTETTPGLIRVDGEVSRPQLFERIQKYLHGGCGPLYCSFDNEQQQPILWQDLLDQGSIIYGGIGTHRFVLDYKNSTSPFADIYRREEQFSFFIPNEQDLDVISGIVLNSGRSSLSDNQRRVQFAIKSFNSGKATPIDDIPLHNPVYISLFLSKKYLLKTGDWVRLSARNSGNCIILPVIVSDRTFGETIYVSFHRSKTQTLHGLYVNDITDNKERCAYSSQAKLKTSPVMLEKISLNFIQENNLDSVEAKNISTLSLTQTMVPRWNGEERAFIVQEIIREADDCTTFKMIPEIKCQIDFIPGQYCTVKVKINGRKYVRSYSISSSPSNPGTLDITVKRVKGGLVSNWLGDNVIIGDCLILGKISGTFHLDLKALPKKLLFIGAGSGVTPLMSMVRWLADNTPTIDLDFYISTRKVSDVLFAKELIHAESVLPNFNLWIIPTYREYKKSNDILNGRISSGLLKRISPDHKQRLVYICGPVGFMQSTITILLDLDHKLEDIYQESFGVAKHKNNEGTTKNIQVNFSGKAIEVASGSDRTLLELAEDNNIAINSACRSGMCGSCLVKVSGLTSQLVSELLSSEQFSDGYRLACICYPQDDCHVDIL